MKYIEEKGQKNEVYSEKELNIGNAKPVDFIAQLKEELKNDVLYIILTKRDLHNKVFTTDMLEKLEECRLYTTKEIYEILSINMGTVNHWLKMFSNYIEFKKIGNNNKIEPKGLVQLRMIQMLRKDSNYALNGIKSLVLPEIEEPNDSENHETLNERVLRMEEEMDTLIESLTKENRELKQIISKMIDPQSLANGQLRLNKEIILPMLEDKSSKEKEIIEKLGELEKEKQEMKENMVSKEEMKKWAIANEEQLNKLLEQTRRKESIGEKIKNTFSSIFGQKK
jgi:hypothetical protein